VRFRLVVCDRPFDPETFKLMAKEPVGVCVAELDVVGALDVGVSPLLPQPVNSVAMQPNNSSGRIRLRGRTSTRRLRRIIQKAKIPGQKRPATRRPPLPSAEVAGCAERASGVPTPVWMVAVTLAVGLLPVKVTDDG